jgi:hypothetical protein
MLRPITWGWHSALADVSVGIAAPVQNNKVGAPFLNQCLTLTAERPPIGTEIVSQAFGGSGVHKSDGKIRVEARESLFDGKLVRYYPYGRDASTMPWPCYETSMRITAGASGGPVFHGDRGTVFAINTSSMEGNDNISFVTPIDVILDAEFDSVRGPDGSMLPRRIRELAEKGWIAFEPSIVHREE